MSFFILLDNAQAGECERDLMQGTLPFPKNNLMYNIYTRMQNARLKSVILG